MIAVNCGHADTCNDTRGADRSRTDSHLDGIGTTIDQRPGALGGRDIAGDDLNLVRLPFDPRHRVQHVFGMSVRGVDHHKIDARGDERLGAGKALVANGRGCGDAQAALLVLAGIGIGHRLFDILHRDQADAAILRVHHQKLLDTVLVQQALGFVLAHAFADGDQLLRHQLGNFLPRIGGETHISVCQDADQLARLGVAAALDHRNPGDVIVFHQIESLLKRSHRARW